MNPAPYFWSTPLKYCRWASRERPAIFWSVIAGAMGPIGMVVGPPIRRWCVPTGPRKMLTGFDDDEEDAPSDHKQS
ncbi:hypothetical protein CDD80_3863 [Ophiocordyceps camponoti-rufipedis]|uniref:NADH-ubiquinone oxidoreductase 9.5 kDa subunit n=1 Tax=Ophiocordyceps camponoti-rufipedis TaxID=2004952 RepID=A0A2C5XI90_9HYPO|nr:hypothetical protein CDD80_3863 [Ophiocordyceps camponoti-rufipedis]